MSSREQAREQCPRCDRFDVLVAHAGARICQDCVDRLAPLERTPPTVLNVIGGGLRLTASLALPAGLLVAATVLPVVLINHYVWTVPPILTWIVDVLVEGALLHMAHRAIRERDVDVMKALGIAKDALVRLLVVSFLVRLQLIALAVVPMVVSGFVIVAVPDLALPVSLVGLVAALGLVGWRASALALAAPIALHEGPRGSPIGTSVRRTRGRRGPALAIAATATLGWVLPWALWIYLSIAQMLRDLARSLAAEGAPFEPVPVWPWLEVAQSLGGPLVTAMVLVVTSAMTAVLYAKTLGYRVY